MPHAGEAGLLLNGVTFIQKSFRPPVSSADAHWDASSAKTEMVQRFPPAFPLLLGMAGTSQSLVLFCMFILIRANRKPVLRLPDNSLRNTQDLFSSLGAAMMNGAIRDHSGAPAVWRYEMRLMSILSLCSEVPNL